MGEKTIGKTLDSIKDFVDYLIVVNGGIKGFTDEPRSRDNTLAIVDGFPKPKAVIGNSTGEPYPSEIFARNLYLDSNLIDEGLWIFIIDDDEWVTQGVKETRDFLEKTEEDYHSVNRWNRRGEASWDLQGEYVRLIRYKLGMKYITNHYTIRCLDGSIIPLTATPTPLVLAHDPQSKPKKYLERKKRYNEKLRGKVEKNPHVRK